MNKAFRTTCDRALQRLFEASPFLASRLGSNTGLDQLDDFTSEGRQRSRAMLEEALTEVRRFEKATLTPLELVDLRCLEHHIRTELRTEEELRLSERCAPVYVLPLAEALWALIERDDLPVKARAEALMTRLGGLERYLTEASRNLGQGYDVPATWTETAIRVLDGLDLWFREALAPFAASAGPLAERTSDAVEGSRRLLLRFRGFLAEKLLPMCDGSFAIGRIHFEHLLDKRHGVSAKAVELVEGAQDRVQAARRNLDRAVEAAGEPSPAKAMRELLSGKPPALGKVDAAYSRQLVKAREAVAKLDLCELPAEDVVEVGSLPAFLWPLCATVAAGPAIQRGKNLAARLLVRPIDKSTPEALREDLLAEHAPALVQLRAVTYGYPGQGLMAWASTRASKVRAISRATSLSGGWRLLAADLLDEAGYFKDAKAKLALARMKLEAAVELELDAKLHMQLTTFEAAVAYLATTCFMRPAAAECVVRRITLAPSEACAAVCGYEELLRTRRTLADEREEGFEPRDLYNKVLAAGGLGLAQARSHLR